MSQKKIQTKTITLVALFTAVLVLLAQITVPLPTGVPLTLQTFAVALTGVILGWKLAGVTMLIYLTLGVIGLPVFAGMKAGGTVLFGATGGFLIGFIFMAMFCGMAVQSNNKLFKIICTILGLATCHFIGVIQFSILMQISILKSFFMVSAPFLVKDVFSIMIAFQIGILTRQKLQYI